MDSLQKIIEKINAGQLDAAQASCEIFIQQNPESAVAYNILGGLLSRKKDTAAALVALKKSLHLDPLFTKAHHNLGSLHGSLGETDQAIASYKQALALDANFLPSNQALGTLLFERKEFASAIPYLEKAVELSGSLDSTLLLAEALQRTGQTAEAQRTLQSQYIAHKDSPALLTLLGSILLDLGKPQDAEAVLREAIAIAPDNGLTNNNLGLSLLHQKRAKEACNYLHKAIELNPDEPNFIFNLGTALTDSGKLEEAIHYLETGISRWPDNINGLTNLGIAYVANRQAARALPLLNKVIELAPHDYEAFHNIGVAHEALKEYHLAHKNYARCIAMNPLFARPYNNLGNLALAKLSINEAINNYQHALHLDPNMLDTKLNLGLTELLLGNLTKGWEGLEWRQHTFSEQNKTRVFQQPKWNGDALNGKTILLHYEQGFGDTIQFIRYAPLVKARGGKVIVLCQNPLKELLASANGIDHVVGENDAIPHFDTHLPLLSLPYVFNTQLDTIPFPEGYLTPNQEIKAHWENILSGEKRLKVGLVWAGNPSHTNDLNRSCPLEYLLPLFSNSNVSFFSLQKNPGRKELLALQAKKSLNITDYTEKLSSFSDTAGFLANLDLLISVDTAVAHLAGSIGTPTWLLLPLSPDWRWLINRDDSPWYKSIRIFRQHNMQQWPEAVDEVKNALMHFGLSREQ